MSNNSFPWRIFTGQNEGAEAACTSLAFGPLYINPEIFPSANKCEIVTDPLHALWWNRFFHSAFAHKNEMMKSNVATDADGNRPADVACPGTLPPGHLSPSWLEELPPKSASGMSITSWWWAGWWGSAPSANLEKIPNWREWWVHQGVPSRRTSAGWRKGRSGTWWIHQGEVQRPSSGEEQPQTLGHAAGKQLGRKNLGVLVGGKLSMSQQRALATKTAPCHRRDGDTPSKSSKGPWRWLRDQSTCSRREGWESWDWFAWEEKARGSHLISV